MTKIPDYSNLQANMNGLEQYFKDSGVTLNKQELALLNSIFKECDISDESGKKKPDGLLSSAERDKFAERLEKENPTLYRKFAEFMIVMDILEDYRIKQKFGIKG